MTAARSPGDLIGRDNELATLRGHLERARAGDPSLVLVGGEAGIGKTRLLSELADGAEARVLWGGCLPMGERGLPYLPVIEMLRSLQDEGEELPPALEVLLPRRGQPPGRAANRSHLFQSVIELFDELSEHGPLLVVVEDLHWADRSTRDLLDFVGALLRNQQILVVASFRTDDLSSDHPLRPLLAEWTRRRGVSRLDVEALSTNEGLRLVLGRLPDGSMSRDQALRLVERAGGNPYFLEELAASHLTHSETPEPLRDLILRRTRGLPGPVLRLLRIASVGGTNIDEEVLARVAGVGIEETRRLLRAAMDDQLVVLDGRTCRFRHALLAEAIHDDLLPAERREYHAAYADALVSGPSSPAPAELAGHQAEAGRIDEALNAWVEAAEAAEAQFAFAESRLGFASALDLWDRASDPEHTSGTNRLELQRRLGHAAFLAGDFQIACEAGRQVVDQIDPLADPIGAALAHDRLARYMCNTTEYGEALAIQQRAVELVPRSETPERAEVISGLARILQFEGRYPEARDRSIEAIELALATGAVEAEISARNTLGNAMAIIDDVERGLTVIREALELARAHQDSHEQARSLWNIHAHLFQSARWEEHIQTSTEYLAALSGLRPSWVPEMMINVAEALFRLGRWDEAEEVIENARLEDPGSAELLGMTELHVARGELALARALSAAKLAAETSADIETHVFNVVNRAEIELAERHLPAAMASIDEVLDWSKGLDIYLSIAYGIVAGIRAAADRAFEARIKGDEADLGDVVAAGRRYHGRMNEVMAQPGSAAGWKREVGALAGQTDAELARLEGRHDTETWAEAERRWIQLSMPYHAAYCRYRWAEAAVADGADRSEVRSILGELVAYLSDIGAKPLAEDVRRLARRARIDLGDRPTPDRFGLTDREREVLARMVEGSTNRQIAAALYISEKTASVHVSNIMRKLGAANRGEASATAIREGLVDLAATPARS